MIDVRKLLHSAHLNLLDTVDGMPTTTWNEPHACGIWSSRETLAHIASIELMLVELLQKMQNSDLPTPILNRYCLDLNAFNSAEIQHRANWSLNSIYNEYETAYQQVIQLIKLADIWQQPPHYGMRRFGSSLAENLVTFGYGHKLAHAAHIAAFRSKLFSNQQDNHTPGSWSPPTFRH